MSQHIVVHPPACRQMLRLIVLNELLTPHFNKRFQTPLPFNHLNRMRILYILSYAFFKL